MRPPPTTPTAIKPSTRPALDTLLLGAGVHPRAREDLRPDLHHSLRCGSWINPVAVRQTRIPGPRDAWSRGNRGRAGDAVERAAEKRGSRANRGAGHCDAG